MEVDKMTKRNNKGGSKNQNAPERSGRLDTEFGKDTGDDNKGNEYNSKRGSKSKRL